MRYKEHIITTLVRTKQFWQYRLRGNDSRSPVYLKYDEIKPFTDNPTKQLNELCSLGQLERVYQKGRNGNEYAMYGAKNKGIVNPSLLIKTHQPLDKTTGRMMEILKSVSLKQDAPSTPYFTTFLNCKSLIQLFFNVDVFSGRVHTPISNFHRPYRKNILIDGEETTSLDVVTMQPVLLGKILNETIGENEFSQWINEGKDIYVMLQSKAQLNTRDEAKKRFFEILFSRPNDSLQMMFGNSNWITWINEFKNKPFEPNPNTLEKNHSNLAWLLQKNEVTIMRKVWDKLLIHDIKFLSVHDEIIVKQKDKDKSKEIFKSVLSESLSFYKLSEDKHLTDEVIVHPEERPSMPIESIPRGKLYYPYELKAKFNLSDEDINKHFEECIAGSLWIPNNEFSTTML